VDINVDISKRFSFDSSLAFEIPCTEHFEIDRPEGCSFVCSAGEEEQSSGRTKGFNKSAPREISELEFCLLDGGVWKTPLLLEICLTDFSKETSEFTCDAEI